jgi:hypothetical protein
MKYEQLFYSLIERYTRVSTAHAYILGFTQGGTVYAAICDSDMLPEVCTIDRASRGAGMSLRFKPTVTVKHHLMETCDCIALCSEKYFMERYNACKHNKGEVFEALVTEYFGQAWCKDSVPFTQAGNVNVNGVEYQIKFQAATFASERTLINIGA